MTVSLSDTLSYLNTAGKILFTHEEKDTVSFLQGNITHRTNRAFIEQLEELAKKSNYQVIKTSQVEQGSARRGVFKITGTVLTRVFAKL
ncbi:MAG: hypothetical protein LLF94_03820 [Chlamydiales bacterium]|nr:hypothetical protein [Chlamydiales bacterium]